ncbi:hypothetical protein [Paenibacillus sp. CF384]|nr:hypothetical protein [Paenibacillus sp. CF384]SDX66226.1 hypothetical protein SAMN05518855_101854 [Paenibacillus sp. CF384]
MEAIAAIFEQEASPEVYMEANAAIFEQEALDGFEVPATALAI